MSRQIGNYLEGHVPPNRKLFGGTVPPNSLPQSFLGSKIPNYLNLECGTSPSLFQSEYFGDLSWSINWINSTILKMTISSPYQYMYVHANILLWQMITWVASRGTESWSSCKFSTSALNLGMMDSEIKLQKFSNMKRILFCQLGMGEHCALEPPGMQISIKDLSTSSIISGSWNLTISKYRVSVGNWPKVWVNYLG